MVASLERTSTASEVSERQKVINWLTENGYPALPVAPAQPADKYPLINKKTGAVELDKDINPKPLFTGKNPSYLDKVGVPQVVTHSNYQNKLPTESEIKTWFANPLNGVGTLGGWNNAVWIDFDVKNFDSKKECEDAALDCAVVIEEQFGTPFIEKTHSGGWRIGISVEEAPSFTNFCTKENGKHIGEALYKGRFTVLAPTIGVSGNPYENVNRVKLPVVPSLEAIGIFSPNPKKEDTPILRAVAVNYNSTETTTDSISLEKVCSQKSKDVLAGIDVQSNRDGSLIMAIKEWYGWMNWCTDNNLPIYGSVEDLTYQAGRNLDIDDDRILRIFNVVKDPSLCKPASYKNEEDKGCWRIVRKHNRKLFDMLCPTELKSIVNKETVEYAQRISDAGSSKKSIERIEKEELDNKIEDADFEPVDLIELKDNPNLNGKDNKVAVESFHKKDVVDKASIITHEGIKWNQSSIAKWLTEKYQPQLAWNIPFQSWYKYSSEIEGIWSKEPNEIIWRYVIDEIEGLANSIYQLELLKFNAGSAKKKQEPEKPIYTADFVNGIIKLMKAKLAVKKWNEKSDLLPFENGVLNLETKELSPHKPENQLTWCLPYNYCIFATCDPIKQWLLETCGGDKFLVHLLRAYLNAVVKSRVDLQSYLELIGPGGTGKSTFTRLATALVGTRNVHITTLQKLETNRFETACLLGKKLVIVNEVEKYVGEVSNLKALTGQDRLPYEVKFVQATEGFVANAMTIVCGNEIPQAKDFTGALKRRRKTIPFLNKVSSENQRNLLEFKNEKLAGEFADCMPGLLNWVLGMLDDEVTHIIQNYTKVVPKLGAYQQEVLMDTNPMADWLDNHIVYRPGVKTHVGAATKNKSKESPYEYSNTHNFLYASYCEYCKGNGNVAVSSKRFGNLLLDLCVNQLNLKAVIKDKDRNGAFFMGLAIRLQEDEDPPLISGGSTTVNFIAQSAVTDCVTDVTDCVTDCVTVQTLTSKGCDECDGFFEKVGEGKKKIQHQDKLQLSDGQNEKTIYSSETFADNPSHPSHLSQHNLETVVNQELQPLTNPSQNPSQPITTHHNPSHSSRNPSHHETQVNNEVVEHEVSCNDVTKEKLESQPRCFVYVSPNDVVRKLTDSQGNEKVITIKYGDTVEEVKESPQPYRYLFVKPVDINCGAIALGFDNLAEIID